MALARRAGVVSEAPVATGPRHQEVATPPNVVKLLRQQDIGVARARGVAALAIGCLAAEACRMHGHHRRGTGHHRRGAGRIAMYQAIASSQPSAPGNFYELLGVSLDSDESVIKHAYHTKMKACHPDVSGPKGVEMSILLNEAYALLRDSEKRQAYDLTLPKVHADQEVDEDPDDMGPSWKYRPQTKEDRGIVKPIWRNRPRSRSRWALLPEEDRGEKWEARQFLYVDVFSCIACRNCLDVAPRTFGLDTLTGRARVFMQWGESEEYNDYAVMSCPVDCIHWVGREELQALEHVTATEVYDQGGILACPMGLRNNIAAGDRTDPFEAAMRFRQKLKRDRADAKEKIRRAGANIEKIKTRIKEAFRQLPLAVRQLGWPRWCALLGP